VLELIYYCENMEVLDDECCELESSTRHSNASRAAAIAKKLAEKKAAISVRLSELPLDVPEMPIKYATLIPYVVIYCHFSLIHHGLGTLLMKGLVKNVGRYKEQFLWLMGCKYLPIQP